jgi:hypothetical protein
MKTTPPPLPQSLDTSGTCVLLTNFESWIPVVGIAEDDLHLPNRVWCIPPHRSADRREGRGSSPVDVSHIFIS